VWSRICDLFFDDLGVIKFSSISFCADIEFIAMDSAAMSLLQRREYTVVPIDRVPDTQIASITTVACVLSFLAIFVVSLRLYTRIFIVRATGWDDWIMVFTLVCLKKRMAILTC
jgi:hypothetical protein